jgi:hypothetical protein
MKITDRHYGFSLLEVTLAVGVLAVGMLFVAGTFPAGVFLTAASTEQTIAPVVADEAFTKIALYMSPDANGAVVKWAQIGYKSHSSFVVDFNTFMNGAVRKFSNTEIYYPSDPSLTDHPYSWSAIVRKADNTFADANTIVPLQVTVFVCRRPGLTARFPDPNDTRTTGLVYMPQPFKINNVTLGTGGSRTIQTNDACVGLIDAGSTIVEDATGEIYRVLDRDSGRSPVTITLDRDWTATTATSVWILPPPISGYSGTTPIVSGKSPCIGVYQRVMKFTNN